MNSFKIMLLTPEKIFFEGEIESITLNIHDGGIEILAGHMLALSDILPGICVLKLTDGTQKIFASNDGIINIGKDKVVVTSDFLEWEDDITKALNERAERAAAESKRRQESINEHRLGVVALQRAFANLKDQKTIN